MFYIVIADHSGSLNNNLKDALLNNVGKRKHKLTGEDYVDFLGLLGVRFKQIFITCDLWNKLLFFYFS